MTKSSSRLVRPIAAALILVFLLTGLSSSQVRASISAWLGLSVAPSNHMPASAVTLIAVTPATPTQTTHPTQTQPVAETEAAAGPTPLSPAATDQPPEIAQLSTQAGWTILTPGHLPEGYNFQSAYFDANQHMVIITYIAARPLPGASDASQTSTQSITFLQALKNDFIPMQVAPETEVKDIQINGQAAAYAAGAWDAEFVKDEKDPGGGNMVYTWRGDLAVHNLYWQLGEVYLCLVTPDSAITQQELIEMAASVSQ